ncbi:MAG TPA: outer membrane beta-barrel protein [Vicinamibacterales bacterium]|nr:outer membrane beta-barrel protein [Vicinamibacterales bacterium]
MKTVKLYLVVVGVIGVLSIPSTARADGFFVPWVGVDTGGRTASSAIDFGANVGTTAAGVIGVDFDFGYAPDFFGGSFDNHVLTAMGNVTVGIPFGSPSAPRFRPYVTGGIGLIRAHIGPLYGLSGPANGVSLGNNDFGVNVGGGAMGFLANHVGVRADLRYIRSVEDDNQYGVGVIDLSRLRYWRTSFGVVLR